MAGRIYRTFKGYDGVEKKNLREFDIESGRTEYEENMKMNKTIRYPASASYAERLTVYPAKWLV